MVYRIDLDDNSFIFADEEYEMTLFRHHKKKKVSLKTYLTNNKLWKYHLVDKIDGKRYKRYFRVTEVHDEIIFMLGVSLGSRLKLAKDIQINDLVVAPDGSPRRIQELHTGEEEMFEISVGGQSYIVNSSHILALVDKETGEHLEIQVGVYMYMDNEFRSHYVMEQVIEE